MTSYMTPAQVAELAGSSTRAVLRAIEAEKIEAVKEEGGGDLQLRRRRSAHRRLEWHIVPASGKQWARDYQPPGRS